MNYPKDQSYSSLTAALFLLAENRLIIIYQTTCSEP